MSGKNAASSTDSSDGSSAWSIVEAIDVLTDDHKRISEIFSRLQQMLDDGDTDVDVKQTLVETVCTELAIHAQIEKELFYPALRTAFDERGALEKAEVKHMMTMQLAAELELMEPGDDLYDAKVAVLGEYVQHHIEAEQQTIFPKARTCGVEFGSLGEDIRRRSEELRDAFGMPDDEFMQRRDPAQAKPDQLGR